ncbi:transposase [Mucilaginibacter phyllosphaerae]
MAKLAHYYTKFDEGCFYHVYNRTIDKQPMFKSEANYEYFLRKYNEYLSPVVDTYAYCLLGNHFHLLMRIHGDLSDFKKTSKIDASKPTHDIISHQFRKFFQSYSMAFNKQHNRIGTLFQTPFKRVLINNDSYYSKIVYYIHANPQSHKLIEDFRNWKWSSYYGILSDKPSKLKKEELIEWFGDKQAYQDYHNEYREYLIQEISDNKI